MPAYRGAVHADTIAAAHPAAFFHCLLRVRGSGRGTCPRTRPVHHSRPHPLVPRPVRHRDHAAPPRLLVAKKELFANRLQAWFLNSLGAFPIDRGNADADAMSTAREILERGDAVVISPRARASAPARWAPPSAASGDWRWRPARPSCRSPVFGTEAIRRRLAHPPAQGPPARRPTAHVPARENPARTWRTPSPSASGRASPCSGSGSAACRPCAARRHRRRLVGHGLAARWPAPGSRFDSRAAPRTRRRGSARRVTNERYLPRASSCPRRSTSSLARPTSTRRARPRRPRRPRRALPQPSPPTAARIPRRAGVLVVAKGSCPAAGTGGFAAVDHARNFVGRAARRLRRLSQQARAVAVLGGPAYATTRSPTAPRWSSPPPTRASRARSPSCSGAPAWRHALDRRHRRRAPAACAKNAAAFAGPAALPPRPNAAGAAAARCSPIVAALARTRGAIPARSPAWPAPATLVATVLAGESRNRRAASCSPRAAATRWPAPGPDGRGARRAARPRRAAARRDMDVAGHDLAGRRRRGTHPARPSGWPACEPRRIGRG